MVFWLERENGNFIFVIVRESKEEDGTYEEHFRPILRGEGLEYINIFSLCIFCCRTGLAGSPVVFIFFQFN